jgi:hypothetical protein
VEEAEKARGHPDHASIAEYYRLEGELWLAQARAGKEHGLPGDQTGFRPGVRPGTDPRSQALITRLEETIPMNFPSPTPLSEVLRYLKLATAGPDQEAIAIYVDPVGLGDLDEDQTARYEKLMQTPIAMNLDGVPLRRTLKLVAEQIGMGYGIKDGMVTMRPPDMRSQNWHELMVMEESFPETSPLALEVERARRGEMTNSELERLDQQLKAIEEVTKRYRSIRMMRGMTVAPGDMAPGTPAPATGLQPPSR